MDSSGSNRYMVEFLLPPTLSRKMMNTIPEQRNVVDNYFMNGKLLSYTLSVDRSKLWAVFSCETESELLELVESLPMTKYFNYEYNEVLFHEMVSLFPALSLN